MSTYEHYTNNTQFYSQVRIYEQTHASTSSHTYTFVYTHKTANNSPVVSGAKGQNSHYTVQALTGQSSIVPTVVNGL